MLPTIRRISSILLNNNNNDTVDDDDSYEKNVKLMQSSEHLSNKSLASSSKTVEDGNNGKLKLLVYNDCDD